MVQFLNACYAAPNTDARRLHRLTHAVLIFDEIQALPTRCRMLFERAIGFLSTCCGCTIVLCTATQPSLDLSPAPVELMPDVEALCARLARWDEAFIRARISPGGCADLLALTLLAYFMT